LTFQLSNDPNDLLEPTKSTASFLITSSLQCQDLDRAEKEVTRSPRSPVTLATTVTPTLTELITPSQPNIMFLGE
jgi:hypothetical protein